MEVTVKAFLQRSGAETEVRRVSVKLPSDSGIFNTLVTKVTTAFPGLNLPVVSLNWKDSDGDLVLMSSDEELREALTECGSSVLKVFISGNVDKNIEESKQMNQVPKPDVHRPDIDREMLPKPDGKGRRCHQKPDGATKMMQGPSGQAYGQPPSTRMGHRRHCEKRHQHDEEDTERHAWKKALRESVPVSHRRWAKMYIHNWRRNNTKSSPTSTTSSCSESEKKGTGLTKELAGIPEAYVVWLDMVLPRFHQSREENLYNDWTSWDEGIEGEADSQIKMSVPVEFRKWVWWFLTKRYGKRSASQTKKGKSCDKGQTEGLKGRGWDRKCGGTTGEGKMHHIASQVPKPVRRWAKGFIQTWRAEHNLPTTKCGKADQVKVTAQDAGVPEEYGQWLLKCLARWHMCRGLVDRSEVGTPQGEMGQFKDTVPNEFRVWAKCYLCKQFGQNQESQGEQAQYQKWLQMFKQKWVKSQQEVTAQGEDRLDISTSEGEGASNSDSADTDMEVDTLLKSIKLDAGKGARNRSDDSDSEGESRLTAIRQSYPGFPKLARSLLSSWDGKSSEEKQTDGDTELPAHVYRWLSSVMIRMHVRKMVRVHKSARKESKLARREMKLNTKSKQDDNA